MKTKYNDFINYKLNEEMKLSKIAKRETIGNYQILVGKSAAMNDILTFDIADDNDYWFHVKGIPGSHVVIKPLNKQEPKFEDDNQRPPNEVIDAAARLAIKNSKAGSGQFEVVYTQRKNVTKNSSHNVGQVNVDYRNASIRKMFSN